MRTDERGGFNKHVTAMRTGVRSKNALLAELKKNGWPFSSTTILSFNDNNNLFLV